MRSIGLFIVGMASLPGLASMPSGIWSGKTMNIGKHKPGKEPLNHDIIGLFLPSGEFRLHLSDGAQIVGNLKLQTATPATYKSAATCFPPPDARTGVQPAATTCGLSGVHQVAGSSVAGYLTLAGQTQVFTLVPDGESTRESKAIPAGAYVSDSKRLGGKSELVLAAGGAFSIKNAHAKLEGRLTLAQGNLYTLTAKDAAASAAGQAPQLKGLACVVKEGILLMASDGANSFTGEFEKAPSGL